MIEERPIPGYEDYLATECGEIVSLKNGDRRVLKPWRNRGGYLRIGLCRDDRVKKMLVHRAVWLALHGPIPPDKEIAHDDGNPSNNKLSNLKCVTRKENNADKWRHGTMACGERNGRTKLTADKVREIRKQYETGNYLQQELAARFGVHRTLVSRIARGKVWSHVK